MPLDLLLFLFLVAGCLFGLLAMGIASTNRREDFERDAIAHGHAVYLDTDEGPKFHWLPACNPYSGPPVGK